MKIIKIVVLSLLLSSSVHLINLTANAADTTDPALELIHALGCKGCHTIKGNGGSLAPDLTQIGSRLTADQIDSHLIAHTETRTKGFMPSYNSLDKADLALISHYLYNLH